MKKELADLKLPSHMLTDPPSCFSNHTQERSSFQGYAIAGQVVLFFQLCNVNKCLFEILNAFDFSITYIRLYAEQMLLPQNKLQRLFFVVVCFNFLFTLTSVHSCSLTTSCQYPWVQVQSSEGIQSGFFLASFVWDLLHRLFSIKILLFLFFLFY